MNEASSLIRLSAATLALLSAWLLLAGCGNSGSTGTGSTSTAGSAERASTEKPAQVPGAAIHPGEARKPAAGNESRATAPPSNRLPAALKKRAGGAAPFLVPHGDNSIPTYGSEAPGSQVDEASEVLTSYLSARQAADWTRACSLMTSKIKAQVDFLAGGDPSTNPIPCPTAYPKLVSTTSSVELADPFSGSLAAFRVRGENAFALFYGPGHRQYMMPMGSEGGRWRVNQIAPVPYPPGPAGGTSGR